jgi:hypothetical protein
MTEFTLPASMYVSHAALVMYKLEQNDAAITLGCDLAKIV